MVEFLQKFENHDIKIVRVNSILITKSLHLQLFTLILYGVGYKILYFCTVLFTLWCWYI